MKKSRLALFLAGALLLGAIGAPVQAVRAEEYTETGVSEEIQEGGADAEAEETPDAGDQVDSLTPGFLEDIQEEASEEEVTEEENLTGVIAGEEAEGEASADEPEQLSQEVTWNVTADGKIQIRYQEDMMYPDLRFAVWSKENGQDDLTWVDAKSENGKIFTADFDPANLKHYGNVIIHVYTGRATCLMRTTVDVGSPSVGRVSVEDLDVAAGTCTLVLSDLTHPELIKEITVPTWSDAKQADLVWYSGQKQEGETLDKLVYKVSMNISKHKYNTGTYNVHVYMKDFTGKQTFQTKTTVDFAVSGTVEASGSSNASAFTAEVKDLVVPGGWTRLTYAIWSQENGQDDLKWIDTKSTSVSVALNDFKHLGLFHVHLYAVTNSGNMKFVGRTTITPEVAEPVVELDGYNSDGNARILVKNVVIQSGLKEISAAVWSKENGQDDLRWYVGSQQKDGSFLITVNMKNHKDLGQYYVHAYASSTSGKMIYLGCTNDLVLEKPEEAEVTVTSVNEGTGEFTVKVLVPENSLGVTRIQVPVWCASDQSDIKWYEAAKQSDGSYQVTVKSSNHKEHSGVYKIHVYGNFVNGLFAFLGKTTQELTISPIAVQKDANGKRTVIIRNCASAKSVSVPVWSSDNGQDDLIWYPASKNSSGLWEATIDSANHRNSGRYLVHVYADGAYAGNTSFNLDYSEIKTEYSDLAASMEAAASNQQLILVAASGTSAQITMLNKNSDGSWFQLLTTSGYVGSGGVGPTTEWNRRTPQGIYGFTQAFGIRANPGTAFDYVQVDSSYYWVDDVNSKYYNQFVTTNTTVPDWSSAEHLIDYTVAYGYCLALDYNPDCTPGVGSAIFLHCSSGRPTAGCISVPESVMKKILQLVRTDCKIVIDSRSGLTSY